MLWPLLAFPMFDTQSPVMILVAIMLGLVVHGLMYAAQPAIMAEMFPTRMRYSGVSLGYQVTAIVAGSWAPLIGTALLRQYRSEEHTSELQSLMRISYAVFCLKKKKYNSE